jgi:hypothetical protein
MSKVRVECYAGYKGDEYPKRLHLGDQVLDIREIEDQWYSPAAEYFRVRASDGNLYILKHDQEMHCWSLDGFRKG